MSHRIICVADFETDPFIEGEEPEVFGAGFYDGEQYWEWFGEEEHGEEWALKRFIEHIKGIDPELKPRMVVYMHNGGGFDFNYLMEEMDEDIFVLPSMGIIKCTIHGIEFRDSLAILPFALKAYKKDDMDYEIMKRQVRWLPHNFERIRKYQKNDCLNLHELVSQFVERFGFKLTIAATAFNELKKTGYTIDTASDIYDTDYREYYYGGRTEVFDGGEHKGPIIYMDINSAYPDAMLDEHPFGTMPMYESDSLPKNKHMYFAHIVAISKGALPFRDPETEELFFPNDRKPREYQVTSWEIHAGLETGTLEILEVIVCWQPAMTRNMADFVNKFYPEKLAAKQRGDKATELFMKIILNGAYGKFAQNPRRFKSHCLTEAGYLPKELEQIYGDYKISSVKDVRRAVFSDPKLKAEECFQKALAETWTPLRDTGGHTIWQRDNPGNRFYNVATAASITGHVRAKLWRAICSSRGVKYCDTDSVMCRLFSGKQSDKLGDWSMECVFDRLMIGGKKLYAGHIKGADNMTEKEFLKLKEREQIDWLKANWKKASKGSQLTPWEIERIVVHGETVLWRNKAPTYSVRFGARFIARKIKATYNKQDVIESEAS